MCSMNVGWLSRFVIWLCWCRFLILWVSFGLNFMWWWNIICRYDLFLQLVWVNFIVVGNMVLFWLCVFIWYCGGGVLFLFSDLSSCLKLFMCCGVIMFSSEMFFMLLNVLQLNIFRQVLLVWMCMFLWMQVMGLCEDEISVLQCCLVLCICVLIWCSLWCVCRLVYLLWIIVSRCLGWWCNVMVWMLLVLVFIYLFLFRCLVSRIIGMFLLFVVICWVICRSGMFCLGVVRIRLIGWLFSICVSFLLFCGCVGCIVMLLLCNVLMMVLVFFLLLFMISRWMVMLFVFCIYYFLDCKFDI